MKQNRLRFYRNFAIGIFIIDIILFLFYLFDKITTMQMIAINGSIAFSELIFLVMVIRDSMKYKTPVVLVPKGKISDKKIIANTNLFDKPIVPTNPLRECVFRINLEFSEKFTEPLGFSVVRSCDTDICEQKIDTTCCSKGMHSLNINIHPKEKLNFRFDKDVNLRVLSVEEFYNPG